MRLVEKAFDIAKRELGVHETGHNNPRIVEYLKCTDLDESEQEESTPWCSAFVNYCIQTSGGKGTRNAMARSWLHWGKGLISPVQGCVVVLERGNNGYSGHVGFFYGAGENRTLIKILGGNQSDAVCIKEYPIEKVLGYRTSKD
jgi:uncharacterized protein (TIGR02594 family)